MKDEDTFYKKFQDEINEHSKTRPSFDVFKNLDIEGLDKGRT